MSDPDLIVEYETELGYLTKENLRADDIVEVWQEGPKGPPGPGNLKVQPTNPGFVEQGLWIQTGLGDDGDGMTFWVEDGVTP